MNKIIVVAIAMLLCFTSCNKDEDDPVYPIGNLSIINSYNINITEPSGISFGPGRNTLLIVSDNTNRVYETDMMGKVIRVLEYTGDDLEGVTFNFNENIIAVAEERKREVVLIDYQTGKEVSRYSIPIEIGSENKGLEGISYNPNNNAYYIINEGDPGEMVTWSPQLGIIQETFMTFADDYSSIFTDNELSLLWILSDESRALFKCDYKTNVLMKFNLDISKYEGVVVDNKQNTLYLVNDKTATLEKYTIENE